MQQVKVDVLGLQLVELLIEVPVEILRTFDCPSRELGRQLDLVPISASERLAHHAFAVSSVVGIACIQIVHPVVDGIVKHSYRFGFIDFGTVAVLDG